MPSDSLPPGSALPGSLLWRAQVVEAAVLLGLATLLIARIRFGRWRRWLGPLLPADPGLSADLIARPVAASCADRNLAASVERAADRLPFATKCLPRAMALQWMLHRRKRPGVLILAALPGSARGTLDDLHAWVESGTEVLIGASERPYCVLARFGKA